MPVGTSILRSGKQAAINSQISDYDIFLGIMSRRFGTPTGVAGSGTEEEFEIAYSRWRATGQPHILFYFSDEPTGFPHSDEEEELVQLTRVHEFRKRIRTNALVMHYTASRDFANVLRPQLAQFLHRHFGPLGPELPASLSAVSDATRRQVRDLAKEYELIRELLKPSDARTIRMEAVVTRMRAIAPEIRPLLPELKASSSPGERLVALAVLQLFPDCSQLPWLVQRFAREPSSDYQIEKPFVAYHAAEALREAARRLKHRCERALRESTEAALDLLGAPSRGSDREYVLEDALASLDAVPDRPS